MRRLADGRRLLLLKEEIERAVRPPGPDAVRRHAEYFAYFRRLLAQRGMQVCVILMPNRYSLYGPLLDGTAAVPRVPYLDCLEAELAGRGIQVINGLSVLRPYAAADLRSPDMSFYREDHHWSPAGVERIARAAAENLRRNYARKGMPAHAF